MNIRHHALPLAAAIVLSGCALHAAHAADTDPVQQSPNVSERLKVARDAIQAKNWRKALAELNLAAKDEPRNADVHNLLGYSYRLQAKPDLPKSFEHYRIALQIDPNHQATHNYIGMAYLMDNKPDEARKHLAQIERICGNVTCPNHVSLAKALESHGKSGSVPSHKSVY